MANKLTQQEIFIANANAALISDVTSMYSRILNSLKLSKLVLGELKSVDQARVNFDIAAAEDHVNNIADVMKHLDRLIPRNVLHVTLIEITNSYFTLEPIKEKLDKLFHEVRNLSSGICHARGEAFRSF